MPCSWRQDLSVNAWAENEGADVAILQRPLLQIHIASFDQLMNFGETWRRGRQQHGG